MSCVNSAPPLRLAIENVTVSPDGMASHKGISISIGNPQQIISVIPTLYERNIRTYLPATCGGNDTCLAIYGGAFDNSKSSTYVQTSKDAWNGTHNYDGAYAYASVYFNDQLRFGRNGSIMSYPMLIWNNGSIIHPSALGLGIDSAFIQAGIASGQIPYNGLGIWPGNNDANNPADGSLVLGGYDSNRIDGPFTEFPFSTNCPSCITVTNMTYETEEGSKPMFSNSTETFDVILDPWYPNMNLPPDVFQNFASLINGTPVQDNPIYLSVDANSILGNVSVTLRGGYTSTLPASEIFGFPKNYTSDGRLQIASNTTLRPRFNKYSAQPGNADLNWGMPFLTMNYLVVDHASSRFRLAPAVPEAYHFDYQGLPVLLCEGLASNTTNSSSHSKHSNHTGVIAGGVVGGVAGLVIIAALIFFLLRSRKREKMAQKRLDAAVSEQQAAAQKTSMGSPYTGTEHTGSESGNANRVVDDWFGRQNQHDRAEVSKPHH